MNIPIRVPKAFRVIAHRGSSAYAPENTLPAFRLARKMGVAEVELDVQLTTDGVVVLCHDLVLTRYGHGDVVVEEMASDELLALDMGSWFSPHLFAATPMLSLSQLLKTHGDDFIFHIELKGRAEELAAATCAVVETHRTHKQTIFTSFSYQQLERMRNVSPGSRLGWLVQTIDEEVLDRAAAVLVEDVEQVVRDVVRPLEPERPHRLPELLLRHQPVAVVVPLAEEVDDAHGILREQLTQLVLIVGAETIAGERAMVSPVGMFTAPSMSSSSKTPISTKSLVGSGHWFGLGIIGSG